ncbi:hypothetical protein GCM10027568_23320 [Humibacter soli]
MRLPIERARLAMSFRLQKTRLTSAGTAFFAIETVGVLETGRAIETVRVLERGRAIETVRVLETVRVRGEWAG